MTEATVGGASPVATNDAFSAAVKMGDAMSVAAALDGIEVATVKATVMPDAMRWRPLGAAAVTLVMLMPPGEAPVVLETAATKAAWAAVPKLAGE